LRSGRFDLLFEVPVPDEKTRGKIFRIHTKNKPLGKDIDLKELAKRTEGETGSDIEFICRKAAMFAIREFIEGPKSSRYPRESQRPCLQAGGDLIIKREHFEKAVKLIKKQKDFKDE
jgi:transitional endoplasmic reticulum ATPase